MKTRTLSAAGLAAGLLALCAFLPGPARAQEEGPIGQQPGSDYLISTRCWEGYATSGNDAGNTSAPYIAGASASDVFALDTDTVSRSAAATVTGSSAASANAHINASYVVRGSSSGTYAAGQPVSIVMTETARASVNEVANMPDHVQSAYCPTLGYTLNTSGGGAHTSGNDGGLTSSETVWGTWQFGAYPGQDPRAPSCWYVKFPAKGATSDGSLTPAVYNNDHPAVTASVALSAGPAVQHSIAASPAPGTVVVTGSGSSSTITVVTDGSPTQDPVSISLPTGGGGNLFSVTNNGDGTVTFRRNTTPGSGTATFTITDGVTGGYLPYAITGH